MVENGTPQGCDTSNTVQLLAVTVINHCTCTVVITALQIIDLGFSTESNHIRTHFREFNLY